MDGAVDVVWSVEHRRRVRSRRVCDGWEIRVNREVREIAKQDGDQQRHPWRDLQNGSEYDVAVRGRRVAEKGWLSWLIGQREAKWHYGPWSNTVRVSPSAVDSRLSSIDGHVAMVSKHTRTLNQTANRVETVLRDSLVSQQGTEADVEVVARETARSAWLLGAIEPNVDKLVDLVEELDGSTPTDGGVNVTNVTMGDVEYNETQVFDSSDDGGQEPPNQTPAACSDTDNGEPSETKCSADSRLPPPEQRHFGAVYFDRGKDEVPMCPPNCSALAKALKQLGQHSGRVCVKGRASDDGPASYNLDLAEQRAETVARLLKCHVKPQLDLEFATLTVGEEHWRPGGFDGDPADRRVDIYSCPAGADAARSKPVTLDADCFSPEDDAGDLECAQLCDDNPLAQN